MTKIKLFITADGKYTNLKKGNIIKIVNRGRIYSTYTDMAEILKLHNFKPNFKPDIESKGKILGIAKHEIFSHESCIGVRLFNNIDIIIGPEGIIKIQETDMFDLNDKLFEL